MDEELDYRAGCMLNGRDSRAASPPLGRFITDVAVDIRKHFIIPDAYYSGPSRRRAVYFYVFVVQPPPPRNPSRLPLSPPLTLPGPESPSI